MATVKLQINSVDANGDDYTTNVNYVSPAISDGVAVEFARQCLSFSSNTLKSVNKVITEDISNAEYFPYTLTANPSTIELTQTGSDNAVTSTFTFNAGLDSDTVTLHQIVTTGTGISVGSKTYNWNDGTVIIPFYTTSSVNKTSQTEFYLRNKQTSKKLSNSLTITVNINTGES